MTKEQPYINPIYRILTLDFLFGSRLHIRSSNLLDQILDFGGIGARSLVLFGHCWSLTSSSEMTNASANHCHISRLIGKILELCALFLKCATHRRDTKTSVGSIIEDPEQIAQSDGMLNLAQYCSTIFITSACRWENSIRSYFTVLIDFPRYLRR